MSYSFKSIYLRERKSKICSLNVKRTGIHCRLEGRKRISGGFLVPLSHMDYTVWHYITREVD